ncbi:MAG: DUF924 family protein [Woeseiaceae bacterium]
MQDEVLDFWFKESGPKDWFRKNADFDRRLTERFGKLLEQAAAAECYTWRDSARGRLAEIIVLDQFSRNIYRDTPAAFAQDPMALALAQEAVADGMMSELKSVDERNFFLMPYMHSESTLIHQQAERLFKEHAGEHSYEYELKHKVIVDRFGRYPHRNEMLGRASTAEEVLFLEQPNSSF